MRFFVMVLLVACAAPAGAQAALQPRAPIVVDADSRLVAQVADVDAAGAVLVAYDAGGVTAVRDRSAAGVLGVSEVLAPGRPLALRVALGEGGRALVAVSTQGGTQLRERPAGGAFGPAISLGGAQSRVEALDVSASGDTAVVTAERIGLPGAQLVLRLRPAGGEFGAPVTLAQGVAAAELAFGADGSLVVAWVVRDQSFRGARIEARSGTVAELGPTQLVAGQRSSGDSLEPPSVALTADGRAVIAVSTARYTSQASSQDVAVAEARVGGRFSAPRPVAQNAVAGRVAAGGTTVAVAWTSRSPRPGQAGVRVSLRRPDGSFAPSQRVSLPESGIDVAGRLVAPSPGATQARAGAPTLAVSPRGDVAVSYAAFGDYAPSMVLAAVRLRGDGSFDGPQAISPLGASAQPLIPAWNRDGALVAPFTLIAPFGTRRAPQPGGPPQGVGLAVRDAASPPAAAPRDRQAPRVRMTEPTLADLRAGILASRVTCSEPCAFLARSQINVARDIAKPRGSRIEQLNAEGSTRIAVPLQASQRARLAAGGARVRAILSIGVVDRLGNAGTVRARICLPRRSPC